MKLIRLLNEEFPMFNQFGDDEEGSTLDFGLGGDPDENALDLSGLDDEEGAEGAEGKEGCDCQCPCCQMAREKGFGADGFEGAEGGENPTNFADTNLGANLEDEDEENGDADFDFKKLS